MNKNYPKELQIAFNEFVAKVDQAKRDYNKKIDEILKKADQLKISKLRKKLNI